MTDHVEQLRRHADRLARALEAQAGRLIEVEQENSRLRSTVATLTAENSQLRAMVSAVKAAVTP